MKIGEEEIKFAKTKNFMELYKIYNNFLPHALIIASEDEISNDTISKLLIKKIFCLGDEKPCGACQSCVMINSNTYPDLHILPKGNSFLVSDANYVCEKAYEKPIYDTNKVFYIKNFNLSSDSAQNKLLKILEEPPKSVLFIITTTNLQDILQTIKSRSQIYILQPFSNDEIADITNTEIPEYYHYGAENFPGKMLNIIKNKEDFIKLFEQVKTVFIGLNSSKDLIKYSSILTEDKTNFIKKLEILEKFYRDLLLSKLEQSSLQIAKEEFITSKTNDYSVDSLISILQLFPLSIKQLENNVSLALVVDNLLLKILEVKHNAN